MNVLISDKNAPDQTKLTTRNKILIQISEFESHYKPKRDGDIIWETFEEWL
jgi:hypothetical protein